MEPILRTIANIIEPAKRSIRQVNEPVEAIIISPKSTKEVEVKIAPKKLPNTIRNMMFNDLAEQYMGNFEGFY